MKPVLLDPAILDRVLAHLDSMARTPGPNQTAAACLGHEVRYNLFTEPPKPAPEPK